MDKQAAKVETKDEDEISLKELIFKIKEWWQYLWRKKWIIIAAGLVGGLLGLGYSFIKKPIYTATTTFVLESGEKGGGLAAYAGVASMMGIDLGGGGGGIFQGDNILELYKSRTMIEKTLFSPLDSLSKQPLIERYIEINKLREGWEKKPELKDLHFSIGDNKVKLKNSKTQRLRDSVVSKVVEVIGKGYLSVTKPDKKLNIIKVDVTAKDEVFAKRFNEELVQNVNAFYMETKTKKLQNNVKILQKKTDSVRAVLNGEIYYAAAVNDATPNLNPTRQVQRVAPVQKAAFSAEANKLVLAELLKNLELSKVTLLKEAPLIQIIDEPIFPLEKKSFGKLKGLLLFGFIFGALITAFLVVKKLYKTILTK